VTGDGAAKIDGTATMEFGAAVDQDITFDASASGTLKLDDADTFTGSVSGFDGNDQIDLSDIDLASAVLNYVENQAGTGGTLTVSDGVDTAKIDLIGHYALEGFHATADNGAGTVVTFDIGDLLVSGVDPLDLNQTLTTQPEPY
jgi:hypothetical protein